MPARLADMVMEKVSNVQMAAVALALFAGVISAFVDNVATVLMIAPVCTKKQLLCGAAFLLYSFANSLGESPYSFLKAL